MTYKESFLFYFIFLDSVRNHRAAKRIPIQPTKVYEDKKIGVVTYKVERRLPGSTVTIKNNLILCFIRI